MSLLSLGNRIPHVTNNRNSVDNKQQEMFNSWKESFESYMLMHPGNPAILDSFTELFTDYAQPIIEILKSIDPSKTITPNALKINLSLHQLPKQTPLEQQFTDCFLKSLAAVIESTNIQNAQEISESITALANGMIDEQ